MGDQVRDAADARDNITAVKDLMEAMLEMTIGERISYTRESLVRQARMLNRALEALHSP